MSTDWKTPAIILAAAGLIVAILAFGRDVLDYTAGGISSPSSPTPSSSVELPTLAPTTPRTATPTPNSGPSSGAAPVPDFAPSAAKPVLPNEQRYTLEFGDKTHIDLDSGLANTEGGAEYEMHLSFGRFFADNDTKIVFVRDSQVTGFDGCARGTRIQSSVAHLNRLKRDESICVKTNRGAWAAMKILDVKSSSSGLGAGDITFEVRLFRSA